MILASSNHVVGMVEAEAGPSLYELHDPRVLDHHADLRPDSLYGVSKAFGEALARYHVDRDGLEAGGPAHRLGRGCPGSGTVPAGADVWAVTPPAEGRWLRGDLAEPPRLRGPVRGGPGCAVRWAVVYGTSANPRRIWDLEHARGAIGYVPQDAAPRWLWAADRQEAGA